MSTEKHVEKFVQCVAKANGMHESESEKKHNKTHDSSLPSTFSWL